MEERPVDSSPRQRASTQRTVCQDISCEAQGPHVGTSTLLTLPDLALCDFCLFPKIKSALKGSHFYSVDAVKAKATDLMKKLSLKDLQYCFQQWKIHMEWYRWLGRDHFEDDNIFIV
jgi:hypothetical protein